MKKLRIAGIAVIALVVAGACVAAIPETAAATFGELEDDYVILFGFLITAGFAIWCVREFGKKLGWF